MKAETRVVLNTAVTYGKSVASLVFGLFSSRWILAALGQTDFGLYSVVGGVVVVVTFLNIVLSNSVARFYAVSPEEEMQPWLNAAVWLHGLLAAGVLVLGWPLGEWAVRCVLVIPPERLTASVWVFRTSLAATVLAVAVVPWTALFTAKQRFGEVAIWELLRSAATVGVAGWLLTSKGDRLVQAAMLLAGIAVVNSLVLVVRARRRFGLPSWRFCGLAGETREKMGELMRYAGWRVLGIFGWLAQKQGGAFVVNLSLGARANAAYAIAGQFAVHASSLTSALSSALMPALAHETGVRSREDVNALTLRSCAFSGLLALLAGVPLMLEAESILRLWLRTPPDGSAALAIAFTAAMVIDASSTGIVAALAAKEDIGWWQTFECLTLALTCPLAWACFSHGQGLASLGWVVFAAASVMVVGRLLFARRMIGLSVARWMTLVGLPMMAVFALSFGCALFVKGQMAVGLLRLLSVGATSTLLVVGSGWLWLRRQRGVRA